MNLFPVISSSFRLCVQRKKEILLLCLTLGVLLSLGQQWAEGFIGTTEDTTILSDEVRASELVEKLQTVQLPAKDIMRIMKGDTAILLSYPDLAPFAMELPIFLRLGAVLFVAIVIIAVLSFFIGIFCKLLALHPASSSFKSLLELSRLAVPASLLQLLLVPIAFTWMLFFLGIFITPFVYASLSILLARRGGIFASIRESFLAARRHYWFTFFGMIMGVLYLLGLHTVITIVLQSIGGLFSILAPDSITLSRLGTVLSNSFILLPWIFYEFYTLELSLKIWKGK